jgi:hypothetical protein
MKPIAKLGVIGGIVALTALAFVPSQSASADNCFGLSKDDCALVNGAKGSLKDFSSFNMQYSLALTISGTKSRDVDFKVGGSGPLSLAANTDPADLAAGGKSIQKIALDDTFTASLKQGDQNLTGTVEIRIVNGALYYEGDKLTQGQWRSLDLTQLARSKSIRQSNLGSFLGGKGGPGSLVRDVTILADLVKLSQTPGFIKAQRGTDLTLNDQTVAAQFVYTFDLPTLFSSPNFEPLLKVVLTQAGRKVDDATLKAVGPKLATAFQNSTVTATRLIGTTDKLPHGFGVDIKATLDPSVLGMDTAATPDASATPVSFEFHFLVKLTDIGKPVTVTAPTNATPADLGPVDSATPEATAAAGS